MNVRACIHHGEAISEQLKKIIQKATFPSTNHRGPPPAYLATQFTEKTNDCGSSVTSLYVLIEGTEPFINKKKGTEGEEDGM